MFCSKKNNNKSRVCLQIGEEKNPRFQNARSAKQAIIFQLFENSKRLLLVFLIKIEQEEHFEFSLSFAIRARERERKVFFQNFVLKKMVLIRKNKEAKIARLANIHGVEFFVVLPPKQESKRRKNLISVF
jgi:hypothetical protein